MKSFFEIDHVDGILWEKKKIILQGFVENFYEKIKNQPNVLTTQQIHEKYDKSSIFSTSIWRGVSFLGGLGRKAYPIVFGLESGIAFITDKIFFIYYNDYSKQKDYMTYFIHQAEQELKLEGNFIVDKYKKIKSTAEDILILKEFNNELNSLAKKFDYDILKEIEDKENEKIKDQQDLKTSKVSILQELDKDSNGEIDLIENDFNKLLSKYQKQVIGIDKNYIHQFVKVSNYIKTKKSNIQKIFESIENTSSKAELDERLNLLKNQIHTYELLVFHSINMISALVSEDLITFYEIYESFDKIGIYNSNWENDVSDKLSTIGNKLDDLLLSIYEMENRIVSEISYLNYVTQESFSDLNRSVTANLKDINSSIDVNNLFTAINTYQLYKINKQTKPLLPKK